MLPYLQQRDLQLREVVQPLLHLVLPTLELVVQQLVPELGSRRMQQLVGLQLVVLLVAEQQLVPLAQLAVRQLAVRQLAVRQLAVRQLAVRQLGLLVVQVHSQVPLVELQQVQNSSLVQILVLGESPLLMHQQQVLKLLRELLELLNLLLLVSMF
jgi:hypothetical protein